MLTSMLSVGVAPEVNLRIIPVRKHACFETQGRRHRKSKTEVSVAPRKGLICPPKIKKIEKSANFFVYLVNTPFVNKMHILYEKSRCCTISTYRLPPTQFFQFSKNWFHHSKASTSVKFSEEKLISLSLNFYFCLLYTLEIDALALLARSVKSQDPGSRQQYDKTTTKKMHN